MEDHSIKYFPNTQNGAIRNKDGEEDMSLKRNFESVAEGSSEALSDIQKEPSNVKKRFRGGKKRP